MALVKDRMTAVRGHVYYDINHKLKPAVGRLMQRGQPLENILANDVQIFPPVQTVAQLLKVQPLSSGLRFETLQVALCLLAPIQFSLF